MVYRKLEGELPRRPKDERIVERGLDDSMWELLCQCWSKNPADRPSIEEFVQQFSSPVSPCPETKQFSSLLILPAISLTFSLLATLREVYISNASI